MDAQREAKTFRTFRSGRAAAVVLAAAAVAFASGFYAPTLAAGWVSGPKSEARLIDGGLHDGSRYAGAQIRLSGEAVTYWRDPGEAGVPPTFDFAGSDNVAEADVIYPQPERIDEDGNQVFGYRGDVIFPIRIAPVDPKKPVTLELKLDYAACEKICIPAHAQLSLSLPPQPREAESQLLDDWLRQIPKILEGEDAARFAVASPAPPAGGKPQWRVNVSGEARDLFVEPPTGFYFDVRRDKEKNAFLLTLAQHPGKKKRPELPLRVTVSGPAPAEFDLALPPGAN
jgi:DsbC/DsbD-like thiol-disulfide interchange protein